MTSKTEERLPVAVSMGLIAIPLIYFVTLSVTTIPGGFVGHLVTAWTIAALVAAATVALVPNGREYFSRAEQFGMLAGHGVIALAVALLGFTAMGMH